MDSPLYFVRHGESELNHQKRFAGRLDTPLTELGRQQAEQAADDLLNQAITPALIVSSPLRRARETACLLARRIGYPEAGIIYEPLFIERSFGVLEGTEREEFFAAYSYQDLDTVPGAETMAQLLQRASQAVAYLSARPERDILVVSHSGFYRALYHCLQPAPSLRQEYVNPFQSIKSGRVYRLR